MAASHPESAAGLVSAAREMYVRAEIACYPLTSVAAFEQNLSELAPLMAPDQPTSRVWRACEAEHCRQATGLSIDRLVAIRDHTWFHPSIRRGESLEPVPLHRYLRHLANAQFKPGYRTVEPRQDSGGGARQGLEGSGDLAIDQQQWFAFALPQDLLLAAMPYDPPPRDVLSGNALVKRRLLDAGIAEIHQHSGAGWDFSLAWTGALAALADPGLKQESLESPGAKFEEGRLLARWLLVGAIGRMILSEFLDRPRGSLRCFLLACAQRQERPWRSADGRWTTALGMDSARHTLRAVFRALTRRGARPPEFEPLRFLYGLLHPAALGLAREPPKTLEDVWRCDPVALRHRLRGYGDGERWLVRRALAYLERAGREGGDEEFAHVFWQSQRLRCQYYRHLVERPLTAGLQWFMRFYDRIAPLSETILSKLQPEASFRTSGRGEHVMAALEIRTSGGADAITMAERLSDMMASWRRVLRHRTRHMGQDPELGVIVNFNKERDPERRWKAGYPQPFGWSTHAQPLGAPLPPGGASGFIRRAESVRFGALLRDLAPRAVAMGQLLCAVPEALWLVRGIDMAADELAVPTWVLVPIFRYLQQEAAYASLRPSRTGEPRAPLLQTTAHVGEDFRHLMEGMRRIYESIQYLFEPSGGRLGHAIALGTDPRLWASSTRQVLMPMEDRLWDLVFEWRLYSGYHVPSDFLAIAPTGREARLNKHIQEIAHELWPPGHDGPAPTPLVLAELHHHLHTFMVPPEGRPMTTGDLERALERGLRRLQMQAGRGDECLRVIRTHVEDSRAFARGQRLIDVPIDQSEIDAMVVVQDALRRGVSRRGIVVEVNPTSNLLIGDILDLRNHPLLRLFPVDPDPATPLIPIAIGSDDPVTFSTSLLQEYMRMHDVARISGYPELMVKDWLDRIRLTAFDARFTCPWPPDAQTMSDRIAFALDRYLQRPQSPWTRVAACDRAGSSVDEA